MKRLLYFCGVVAIFCLGICGLSAAETIGNTADIHLPSGRGIYSAGLGDFISLNVGFDTEFLLEKEFKHKNEGSTEQKLEGQFYMARLSLTLFDRIQPYLKLGISDLEMSWNDGTEPVKANASTASAWGAGLKAYLWEFESLELKIFSSASFRITKPDRMESLSVGSRAGSTKKDKFEIYERQVSVGISKAFSLPGYQNVSIVPYIGGVWSETTAIVRLQKGDYPVNAGATGQTDNAGLFLGADILFADNFSLNLEGRFIDQQAVSVGFTALI